MGNFIKDIYELTGAHTKLALKDDELEVLRKLLRKEYLSRIKKNYSSNFKLFEDNPMNNYHNICKVLDHKKLWPKKERCLNESNLAIVKQFEFFDILRKELGDFIITDEDEIGREEIYWRLVRPNQNEDVGPIHADNWFWELNQPDEKNAKRIKVWLPVYCDVNNTGFRYVPNSHKTNWNYSYEFKDNKYKPIPQVKISELEIVKFDGNPGQIIVFNDKLLHGGYTTSEKTRVSLELTLRLI